MPHFIMDCSEDVLAQRLPDEIMQAVYDVAEAMGPFAKHDSKVRIHLYAHYKPGENKKDFIHVFAHIMEDRSTEQKATFSRKTIERPDQLFPNLSVLSMNVQEFGLATYCNKSIVHPLNTTKNRHF